MEIEALVERLASGDPDARDTLRRMGPQAAPAAEALGRLVAEAGSAVRLDALFVLEGIGPDAVVARGALVAALADEDPDVSAQAADTLGAIGADAVHGLGKALDHEEPRVRRAACQALGVIGAEAAGVVDRLLKVADADQEEVRERAVWALGEIAAEEAVEPLAELFTRDGGAIGCWIAAALARYGRKARRAADALRDELHRDDPYLALAAAEALERIGMYEDAAVWALISMLQSDPDADVRAEAALILAEYGTRAASAVPALRNAEREEAGELRAQARMALLKIRPEAVAATAAD